MDCNADIALIIGDKNYRNATYTIETLSLLLQIAFNQLNLKSAHMSSNPFTPVLEKMFDFIEAGRLSNFMYSNGEYVDLDISQLKKLIRLGGMQVQINNLIICQ